MVGPNVGNVTRVYRYATDEQRMEGLAWYRNAHGFAVSLDPGNPRRAAGVIAALSPKTSWARNVELAGRAYADGEASGTLGVSCRAADAILAGADPLDALTGPKVRSFFTLIADPEDGVSVCIDRHAVDVALGERLTERDRSRWPLARRGLYGTFADCYREAGDALGVSAADVQAVTWVAWRATL